MSADVPRPRQTFLDTEVKPQHGKQPLGLDITLLFSPEETLGRPQAGRAPMLQDTTLVLAFTKGNSQGQRRKAFYSHINTSPCANQSLSFSEFCHLGLRAEGVVFFWGQDVNGHGVQELVQWTELVGTTSGHLLLWKRHAQQGRPVPLSCARRAEGLRARGLCPHTRDRRQGPSPRAAPGGARCLPA